MWERSVEEWLREGYNKRIDPIVSPAGIEQMRTAKTNVVRLCWQSLLLTSFESLTRQLYHVNKPIYDRLAELLKEEQMHRDGQIQYFQMLAAEELNRVKSALESRAKHAEDSRVELGHLRVEFATELRHALTTYLKGELYNKQSRIEKIEKELRNAQAATREAKEAQGSHQKHRVEEVHRAVWPLNERCAILEQSAKELVAERRAFLDGDPRKQVEEARQQRAEAEARVTQAEAQAAELRAELTRGQQAQEALEVKLKQAEEMVAKKSLEFGEKEFYQTTVRPARAVEPRAFKW